MAADTSHAGQVDVPSAGIDVRASAQPGLQLTAQAQTAFVERSQTLN